MGIAYLNAQTAQRVKKRLEEMVSNGGYEKCFWEEALWERKRFFVNGRLDQKQSAYEINSYEELQELDPSTRQLKSDIVKLIAGVFHTSPEEIKNIEVLKASLGKTQVFLLHLESHDVYLRISCFIPWGFYLVLVVAFGFMLHVRKRNRNIEAKVCIYLFFGLIAFVLVFGGEAK